MAPSNVVFRATGNVGGLIVLQKLGVYIADALARAEAAEARAREATDPQLRAENEFMAKSWRRLARSFQFAESLEQFLLDSHQNRKALPPKPLPLDEE